MLKPCWRLYFKVSPLPLSFIDNAKVRQKSDICKLFWLKNVKGLLINPHPRLIKMSSE